MSASRWERLTTATKPARGRQPGADGGVLPRRACGGSGGQTQPLGALAFDAAPNNSLRRSGDDTESRLAPAHDRNVDGEFITPGDQFTGPVEGVDQDEAVGDAGGKRAVGRRCFFRHHADARKQPREPREDNGLGRMIGRSDRGQVRLGPRVERAGARREDGCTRGGDEGRELIEEPAVERCEIAVPYQRACSLSSCSSRSGG